ncbi:MAG: ATPase [Clostridiales bacterium]|nr:ATPase [Clostridiales bacterium]
MIEKMEFLSITGPKDDLDRVVNTYLSRYEIHLENALSQLTAVENLSPFLEINPYKEALTTVNGFYEELGSPDTAVTPESHIERALSTVKELQAESERLTESRTSLEEKCRSLSDALRTVCPFRNMDFDISSILKFKYIHYRFGRIEKQYYENFKKYIYDDADTIFIKGDSDDQYVWGIYFVPEHAVTQVDAAFTSMHFQRFYMPDIYRGTAREANDQLENELAQAQKELADVQEKMQLLVKRNQEDILAARATILQYSRNFDVRKAAACTHSGNRDNFYILCGWMTEKDAKAFQQDIQNDGSIFCMIETENSRNSDLQPPTKLKSPRLFKPFEMYVKMYGLPSYGEMDPTWFVALTYSFIFGAMFGDAGQGLVLFIGGFLLYKFKHMDLAGIISCAGIFSTFFGLMFGSFFGFEDILPALWLRPMDSMMTVPFIGKLNTVFIIAIGFGMCLILLCMVFNIINSVRAGDIQETWFDTNAVAGLVFYGSIFLVLILFVSGHTLPAGGILTIMFGVPLLLMLFKEPISRKLEKKSRLIEGGWGMFFVQGFFELFEVLLSYFSNTLSFVRIGAFAVSHAAMMQVVLMLAGAESGNTNWVVIVLGNLIVMGMEGLIVGIQVLRLEYYEMFSRFYHGRGRAFEPFPAAPTGH